MVSCRGEKMLLIRVAGNLAVSGSGVTLDSTRVLKFAATVLLCVVSACTSTDHSTDQFAKLRALDGASRSAACLALSNEEKINLFFEAQQRHHEYFGFDDCFASSSPAFISALRSEIVTRGTVESARHYIIVIAVARRQGSASLAQVENLELPMLCKVVANESPSGDSSQCIRMAVDLSR